MRQRNTTFKNLTLLGSKIKTFKTHIMLFLLCLVGTAPVYADTADMNAELARLVAGLDALLPIISAAEAEQDPNAPVQFHFENWKDANGVMHNGLRQDVLAMKAGIVAQINQPVIAPRTMSPLSNDYVSDTESGVSVAQGSSEKGNNP